MSHDAQEERMSTQPDKENFPLPDKETLIRYAQGFYRIIVCAAYYGVEKRYLEFKGAADITQFLMLNWRTMCALLEEAGASIEALGVTTGLTTEQIERSIESAFIVVEAFSNRSWSATHFLAGDVRKAARELIEMADRLQAGTAEGSE